MTEASVAAIPPVPRSTFVSVLAWLGIILFGSGALMFGVEGIVFRPIIEQTVVTRMTADSLTPLGPQTAAAGAAMMPYFFLAFVAVMALGVAASIGLLHRRNWGRIMIIAFLILNTIGALFGLLGGLMLGSIPMAGPPSGLTSGPAFDQMMSAMRILMIGGSIVVALIGGWLTYRLLSKSVSKEFAAETD